MIATLFLAMAFVVPGSQDRNPACTAEMRSFVTPQERLQTPSRTLARDATLRVGVSTAISSPADRCLSGQIMTRATYFDANDRFICSGNVVSAVQREHTQVTLLEIRPWRTQEFVLWENGPPGSLPIALLCRDTNGAVVLDPWHAKTMRLQITALPKNGGVASVEFQILLEAPEQ